MSVECQEAINRNLLHAHHERKRLGKKSKQNEGEIEIAVSTVVFGGISLQGSCVWRFPELVKWTTQALGSHEEIRHQADELANKSGENLPSSSGLRIRVVSGFFFPPF